MSGALDGRVALVTGAGGGIGRGICLELARAGATVIVNDRAPAPGTTSSADETVREVTALGATAEALFADVSSGGEVTAMFDDVMRRYGRIDILVNNAGVQTWKPFLEVTEEEWDFVIRVNLKGCFLCSQAAARFMVQAGRGSIINIGSGCNKVGFPNLVAYTASKGGIEMLTKVAALELGPRGVRVNCVAPGAIEIERTKLEDPDYAGKWGSITPVRRIGTPEDIARAVAFFASDASSFISGQTVWVDGALFSQGPWAYKPEEQ